MAVLLSFLSLYQLITKSVFRRGNDLVTVLLTGLCAVIHTLINSHTKVNNDFNGVKIFG